MKEPIILNTSDEAAKLTTVTGWVARDGVFYGNNERTARWAGATHMACKQCGTLHEKMWTLCKGCRDVEAEKRWDAMERKPWDGQTPVCLHDGDEYFWDAEQFYDWCHEHDVKPKDVRLVHCDPVYASQVDVDHWCDELPDEDNGGDGCLPPELQQALDEFNAKIAAYDQPLSWIGSKIAVDPASLDDKEAA